MESFDPIGGFRTKYRVAQGEMTTKARDLDYTSAPYGEGAPVDASGVTPDGDPFTSITEYKRLLLEGELDQVARHLTSQLLVFSTGAEVEFADRDAVEEIVEQGRRDGHPVRAMIHAIAQSDLFRQR